MPATKYRLEPVLRYRQVLTDQAIGQLGALQLQRVQVEGRIREIAQETAGAMDALGRLQQAPQPEVPVMQRYVEALDRLRRQEAQQRQRLADVDALIAAQREAVAERRKDQEALQTLKDKFLEGVQRQEAQAEARLVDEAVSVAAARGGR